MTAERSGGAAPGFEIGVEPEPGSARPAVLADELRSLELPPGLLRVRLGPGANCSSAGSAVDVLFYASVVVGAVAVALAAAFPPEPEPPSDREDPKDPPPPPEPGGSLRSGTAPS